MAIIFSPRFEKELEGKRGVTKDVVRTAIAYPVKPAQKLSARGLRLELYLGRMKDSNDYVIVWSHVDGHNLVIDSAFRVSQELVNRSPSMEPLALFRVFIDRFGLPIPLAPDKEKFYFDQLVPVNSLKLSDVIPRLAELTRPVNPNRHRAHSNLVFKPIEQGGTVYLECANAFCIDIDEYEQSN